MCVGSSYAQPVDNSQLESRRNKREKLEIDATDLWGRSPSPEQQPDVVEDTKDADATRPPPKDEVTSLTIASGVGSSAAGAGEGAPDEDVKDPNSSDEAPDNSAKSSTSSKKSKKEKKSKKSKSKKKKKKSKSKSKKGKKSKQKRKKQSSSESESESEESEDTSLLTVKRSQVEEIDPGPEPLPQMSLDYGGALLPGEVRGAIRPKSSWYS